MLVSVGFATERSAEEAWLTFAAARQLRERRLPTRRPPDRTAGPVVWSAASHAIGLRSNPGARPSAAPAAANLSSTNGRQSSSSPGPASSAAIGPDPEIPSVLDRLATTHHTVCRQDKDTGILRTSPRTFTFLVEGQSTTERQLTEGVPGDRLHGAAQGRVENVREKAPMNPIFGAGISPTRKTLVKRPCPMCQTPTSDSNGGGGSRPPFAFGASNPTKLLVTASARDLGVGDRSVITLLFHSSTELA